MLNGDDRGKLLKTALIFALVVSLAFALYIMELRLENILLVFVVGVLVISVASSSFIWGITAAVLFILTFNFFFTEPRFTFNVDDPNYLVSFVIFFIVAALGSTLMSRLQSHMYMAKHNAAVSNNLYEVSKGFWRLSDEQAIVEYATEAIADLLKRSCKIFILDRGKLDMTMSPKIIWCFVNAHPCGSGENKFSDDKRKYLPIRSESHTFGVVSVDCTQIELSKEDGRYLNTVLLQLTIALERHRLNIAEEENRIKIERENLRSNLLRSISHDLRTPLTGIAGCSGLLIDNLHKIDTESVRTTLRDIHADSIWLSGLVENLLQMTRIQDGRLTVTGKIEVVEDVVAAAVGKVSKRREEHSIKINKPSEVIVAHMDAQLIIQVLINLLDNAFRHTPDKSVVELSYGIENGWLALTVSDNGTGISEEKLPNIFEPFYSTAHGEADKKRGMGLGLSICRAIVNAHGGSISAENNKSGGARFRILLPSS